MFTNLHWVTGVSYARMQSDVSYQEWCDLYYNHREPTIEQIQRACETALPILHRNEVINPNTAELHGMTDGPDAWPRRDDPHPLSPEEIAELVKARNMAVDQEGFHVEGPWAFKDLENHEAPLYIFQKGTGEKVKVGKAVAKVEGGLRFDIDLQDEYKDIKSAGFEMPMRYNVRPKTQD